MKFYVKALKQYADFNTRASRKEYWMFTLFNIIFLLIAIIIDNVVGLTLPGMPYGLFYILYALAFFIPGLSVAVRRLHDVGKSGWMMLLAIIPIVGAIWLLVLMVTDSQLGENEYGLSSKGNDEINSTTDSNSLISDNLILAVVLWMLFIRIIHMLIPYVFYNFFSSEAYRYFNLIVAFIGAFIPLVLAFTVKNKNKRLTLFILGGVLLAFGIFQVFVQFNGLRNFF